MNPSHAPQGPSEPRLWVVIPCAGSGTRAATQQPKQYQSVQGRPLVGHTLAAFSQVAGLQAIVVALAPGDSLYAQLGLPTAAPVSAVPCGGETRAQTVLNSLAWLRTHGARDADWVLVHDAARCLITPAQISSLIDRCRSHAVGGLLAQRLADTLKQGVEDGDGARVLATVPRTAKWLAQTPQMFRLGLLEQALGQSGPEVTDEASAVEALGHQPLLVPVSGPNGKVTFPEDIAVADALLAARDGQTQDSGATMLRIGQGWDTHALVAGRALILGGVRIEHSAGLLGHSDADALTHAIIDALLGAVGLGDIGRHFPDTDERYRGADSMELLRHTVALLRSEGYAPVNVDSTVVAQAPKLAPHIAAMRSNLATHLGLPLAQVNVKAKTAEGMGPVGEGRAMEAQAVVLLRPVTRAA